MKTVIYAGSQFVTGDAIATALLGCSQVLAGAGEAETVSLPTLEPDGSVGSVLMLIGPASQIVVRDGPPGAPELVDEPAVARLEAIRHRRHPTAALDLETPDPLEWDGDF